MSKIHLEVVTPDSNFFKGDVRMFVIETTEGQMGVMHDHEPLVTPIAIGRIWIDEGKSGKKSNAFCGKGFLTIDENIATVVVDAAEWQDNIDVDRAHKSKERAEKLLAARHDEIDVVRAKASLERALSRVKVSKL